MGKKRVIKPSPPKRNTQSFLNLLSETIKTKHFQYPFITLLIVFLVYSSSLLRPWLPYDERLIYKENFFPIPISLAEAFEIIKVFIVKSHLLSINSYFSNYTNLRICPVSFSLTTLCSFFFQKNYVLYHLLQLIIHLINSLILFIMLVKISQILSKNSQPDTRSYLLISLFTLLWALHPTNIEAVLLVTNWTGILTYLVCMAFILYEVIKVQKNNFDTSKKQFILTAFAFFSLMYLGEQGYILPVIILFIVFGLSLKILGSAKNALPYSARTSMPYFAGLMLYFLVSLLEPNSAVKNLFSPDTPITQQLQSSPLYTFVERNLWLSPQIFLHFLKLMLFPKVLSTYQSNLVKLSDTLISSYSVFATVFYITFLLIPTLLFLTFRKKSLSFIFLQFYGFFFAVVPFLHIITPTYCLSADRYNYFPSFIAILIIFQIFYHFFKDQYRMKVGISALVAILLVLATRTLVRINEWNNPYKIYLSAAKSENNPLYKAHRLSILADYTGERGNQHEMENLLHESLNLLSKAKKYYQFKMKETKYQPVCLKDYGLDYKSLFLKTIYTIGYLQNDNFQAEPKEVLKIIEPYFTKNLDGLPINIISFYSEVLVKGNLIEKAEQVLKSGYKKYYFSEEIANKLGELYLTYLKENEKAYAVLFQTHNLFPNNSLLMYKLMKYYEQKNDLTNQAKMAYLIGLREHSEQAYQNAAKIYLDLNQLELAHKTLKKLAHLKSESPLTYLLVSRYLDVSGKRKQILSVLNSALLASIKQGDKQDPNTTKSILISLIKVNLNEGNIEQAKKYINAFEQIKDFSSLDKVQLSIVKKEAEEIEKRIKVKSAFN